MEEGRDGGREEGKDGGMDGCGMEGKPATKPKVRMDRKQERPHTLRGVWKEGGEK